METLQKQLETEDVTAAATIASQTAGDEESGDKKKNIGLERVRISGAVKIQIEKCRADLTRMDSELKEVQENVAADPADKQNEYLLSAQADILSVFHQAQTEVNNAINSLIASEKNLVKIENIVALNGEKAAGDKLMRDLHGSKSTLTKFFKARKDFLKTMDQQARDGKLAAAAANGTDDAHVQECPLFTIAKALFGSDDKNYNVTQSFFEAKSGVRVACFGPRKDTDPAGLVSTAAKIKRSLKELDKHLLTNAHGISKIAEPIVQRKIRKDMHVGFDPNLFSQLSVPPSAEWGPSVYEFQVFGLQKNYVSVAYSHMCQMEARLLFSGEEIVMGIPASVLPGGNLKEKRAQLFQLPMPEVQQLVQQSGWAVWHDNTKLVLIPTGFLVVVAALDKTTGLRWSVSSDEADTNRCKEMLAALLAAFPEMANASTGYSQWRDWLASM